MTKKELNESKREYERIKKKLVEAWSHRVDHRGAAVWAGITQERYENLLSEHEELRDLRAIELERPLIAAQMNIAEEVYKGKFKASQYTLETFMPETYGNRQVDVSVVKVPIEEKEKLALEFLSDLSEEVTFEFDEAQGLKRAVSEAEL